MSTTCCTSKRPNCDKDFTKTRLMRMEQVRQQSRNIAENVRTKVRNEKAKQLSQMEQRNKADLKVWQARKLLEAQSQYERALINFGLGHKQAKGDSEEQVINEKKEAFDKIAKERGSRAMDKLQADLSEKSTLKTMPIQRRKTSREIEDIRAGFVRNISKMKKICPESVCQCCPCETVKQSDVERRNGSLESVNSSENSDIDTQEKIYQQKETHRIKDNGYFNFFFDKDYVADYPIHRKVKELEEKFPELKTLGNHSESDEFVCDCYEKYKRNVCDSPIDMTENDENINNTTEKTKAENVESKEEIATMPKVTLRQQNQQIHKNSKIEVEPKFSENEVSKRKETNKIKENIPKLNVHQKVRVNKPKSTYDSSKSRATAKVPFYDEKKRNFKQFTTQPEIQRISANNLVVSPTVDEENERIFQEKMQERDKEAEERGRKAMEKEMTQRNYRELLKKLPLLQKQERIHDINKKDRPEYHMSEERRKDLHNKQQLHLENAYEGLFAHIRPKMITIPKRVEVVEKFDFSVQKDGSSLNLMRDTTTSGTSSKFGQKNSTRTRIVSVNSDVEEEFITNKSSDKLSKKFERDFSDYKEKTVDEINSNSSVGTNKDKKNKEEILAVNQKVKLKENKEELMENQRKQLQEMLDDIKTQKNRLFEKVDQLKAIASRTKHKKSLTYQIPPKTKKTKRKILVLQNSSTQTSYLEKSESDTKQKPELSDTCTCENVEKTIEGDHVCKILIHLKENEKPKVVVNPQESDNKSQEQTPPKSHKVKLAKQQIVTPPTKRKSKEAKASWRDQFSQNSTTTTSYMSPPDPNSGRTIYESSNMTKINVSSQLMQSMAEPGTLMYVKKLLQKSRASIESLTVSSATDITTPSQSTIEMDTNVPNVQWEDIAKRLCNMRIDAVSDRKNNTSNASTTSSNHYQINKSDGLGDQLELIEETYSKKISSIDAMIKKIRDEKKKMLSPNYSYEESLPCPDVVNSASADKEQQISQNGVLKIDSDYASQLQKLTDSGIADAAGNQMDKEVRLRFEKLIDNHNRPKKVSLDKDQLDKKSKAKKPDEQKEIFSSVWFDLNKMTQANHKRPPPSKGHLQAKRYNGDVSLVPRELPTIAEADSQVSFKSRHTDAVHESKAQKPAALDKSSEEKSDMELTESMLHDIGMEWAIPILKKTKESLALSSSSTSSLDSSLAKKSAESLRDFLSCNMFSSSSGKTDGDTKSSDNVHELSGRRRDKERENFTSTPVDMLGEAGIVFGNESELSSVRENG